MEASPRAIPWHFIGLLYKLARVLLVVFGLTFLLNLYLSRERVLRNLGPEAGVKGWATAIVGGVLSVGPVYAWYPLLKDLKQKGMGNSLAAAFLYSRGIKLPLLPLLIHYFGWRLAIIVSVDVLVFAFVNGIGTEQLLQDRPTKIEKQIPKHRAQRHEHFDEPSFTFLHSQTGSDKAVSQKLQ